MERLLTQFASEAASGEQNKDLFASLGIDWTLLIVQLVAFLILVWLLGKFVYPVLVRTIDAREEKIAEAGKAAEAAEMKAEQAEAKIDDALKQARVEAADIVATAKQEATQMVEKAEAQAKIRSDRIVAEAQADIQKEVILARKALHKETISLVKKAAGLAVAGIADDRLDTALIKKSVEEASR
ncbi:MAG: F0F1 ATP synthase subunit B [Candidatus Saccharimonadales bacterium]